MKDSCAAHVMGLICSILFLLLPAVFIVNCAGKKKQSHQSTYIKPNEETEIDDAIEDIEEAQGIAVVESAPLSPLNRCLAMHPQPTRAQAAELISAELTDTPYELSSNAAIQQEIDTLIQQVIQIQKSLSRPIEDGSNRVDLLMLLARYNADLATRFEHLSRCKPPKNMEAFHCSPSRLEQKSVVCWENHIKTLMEIRNKYPTFPQYDEVLFAISFRIETIARKVSESKQNAYEERAMLFYDELLKKHPESRFAPMAYFLIGEHHLFDTGEFDKALHGYEMVQGLGGTLLSVIMDRKALISCAAYGAGGAKEPHPSPSPLAN